ncbi:hypothetical protein AB0D67_23635 [Streptosporangium sp. NPDC048047]|uniref:hypothetical protein n=1 Tax=Streptosporangium sp. NPDC048047 TaxID=3155748 RepID=UPI0034207DE8
MTAVVIILVAVVLLVLVVVALGMRSMSRRESALPAERLREMAEKEAQTPSVSIDDFASREPKMTHYSPDLTPFDEPKPSRPRPSGARGKRGMNDFGGADDYDDDYWTRLQADVGGFGGSLENPAGAGRAASGDRASSGADPDATTVQAPLPHRKPQAQPRIPASAESAAASLPSGLSDLTGPVKPEPAPTSAALAEQKTVTFAAPTAGAPPEGRRTGSRRGSGRSRTAGNGGSGRPDPLDDPLNGPTPRRGSRGAAGQSPATGPVPAASPAGNQLAGPLPPMRPMGPTTSGGFPVMSPNPSAGSAPDPLAAPHAPAPRPAPEARPAPAQGPAAAGTSKDVADNPWAKATSPVSGGWPAVNTADILDDPAPSYSSYQSPVYGAPTAGSYEVSPGWATIEDDALTGPTPALSTPTAPSRSVSPGDRAAGPRQGPATGGYGYDPVRPASPEAPAAWPEPAPGQSAARDGYGTGPVATPEGQGRPGSRRSRRAPQQPDHPDYYR